MKILMVVALALLVLPARASAEGCLEDAMGTRFCAREPAGVAVRGGLGEILCARGQCVQDPSSTEWHCSRTAGGWARMGDEAPECEQGCMPPSESACEQR